jgi:hypothetical protein
LVPFFEIIFRMTVGKSQNGIRNVWISMIISLLLIVVFQLLQPSVL